MRQHELEAVLEGLKAVMPLVFQEHPQRGDDFLSILLIYEKAYLNEMYKEMQEKASD